MSWVMGGVGGRGDHCMVLHGKVRGDPCMVRGDRLCTSIVSHGKVRGDQAAHATLAPDRNPPGGNCCRRPIVDARFKIWDICVDFGLVCPIRDFSDYFHISPSGYDNWLKRISAVIQD